MADEELAEPLHLREALPAEGFQPANEDVPHTYRCLVHPKTVQLLAQDVGLEEPPINREELLELVAFRAPHGLPPPEQKPALAAPVRPHHGAGAKELLAADVVERGAGVLEDMELVEHHIGLRQDVADGVQVGPMHVSANGANGAPLMRVEIRGE